MKRTKSFFIALLGFCLMGSGVIAQTHSITKTVADGDLVYGICGDYVVVNVNKSAFDTPTITGELTIKAEIEGVPVTTVWQRAFMGQTGITSVNFPPTLTTIEADAFNGCEGLTSLNLSSISSVGDAAFYKCKNIETLTVGSATLGTDAFRYAPVSTLNFVNVTTIPAGVATQFASTLKTVTFPETAKNIAVAASAFSGCSSLTSIDLSNVTSIGSSAFSGCTGLKSESVNLSKVTSIGSSAFSGCTGLTGALNLSNVELGSSAFAGTGYSAVNVSGISELPNSIFNGCMSLSMVILNGVQTIGDNAFENCKKIASVYWGTVASIGSLAFSTTGLISDVELPATVNNIGADAFTYCNLASVIFNSDPTIGDNAFVNVPLKLKIDNDKLYSAGNTYDNVTYSRSKNGTYGALVLPFNFEKGSNTYYTFTSYDEKGMHFTQVEDNELKANTPYLYTGSDTKFKSVGEYTTEALVDVKGDAPDGWTWNCVYEDHSESPITNNGFMWAIQGGELKWFNSLKIKPYRAYWQTDNKNVSQNARVFVHTRDGNVTSINMAEIDGWENMVPVYYDLTGRMVNNPVKGNIYIVNGKKVVF